MLQWIGLLMMSAAIAGPVGASVYKDFSKVWEQRDATYRTERQALEARARLSADTAIQSLTAGDPTAPDDLVMALTAAWSLSELVGRGQLLWALREHMASKPSAALSEAWLQGKIDELRRKDAEADLIAEQMDMLKGRDTVSVQHWIAALEQLSMMRGNISGAASELALVHQNLGSYYRARAEEQAEAQAMVARVLAGLADTAARKQRDFERRSAACARTRLCR